MKCKIEKPSLSKYRKSINKIDKEMMLLFKKRMEISKMISLYKKRNKIPIFDKKLENEIININSKQIKNTEIKKYYLDFIKNILKISKEYQKENQNKKTK